MMRAMMLAICLISLHVWADEPSSHAGSGEYTIKAVSLFNFCRFIEWPDSAFPSSNTPITIGVIGADPFGPLLDDTVRGETVRNRSIRIERYRRVDDVHGCHLLFVCRSETSRFDAILAALRGRSIATVGESEEFMEAGGMIALISDQNRIRLRINPDRLRAAKLSVSAKLLRVATVRGQSK